MKENNKTTIQKFSPKQFSSFIKDLRKEAKTVKKQQYIELKNLKKDTKDKITNLNIEKARIKKQYFVENIFDLSVYVDHIEYKNDVISFDNLQVYYDKRLFQYERVLKSGKIKYYTKNTRCIVFANYQRELLVPVDLSVKDIKEAVSRISMIIEQYPDSKIEIDNKISIIENEIIKARKDAQIEEAAINKNYSKKLTKIKEHIDSSLKYADRQQLNELNKKRDFLVVLILLGITLSLIFGIISNIIKNITISNEQNRNYWIDVNSKALFECNAEYDEKTETIKCSNKVLLGSYSKYDTIYITNENTKNTFNIKDDKFIISIPKIDLTSYYKTEDFNEEELLNKEFESVEKIKIYNNILNDYVLEKEIVIGIELSNMDRQLIKEKNELWKNKIAEQKAKEEAERKAREEAAQKAREEAERIRIQEENQRKQKECLAKGTGYKWNGSTCYYSKPVSSSGSKNTTTQKPSSTSTNSNTSNLPLKAICKDGTTSYQDDPTRPDYRGMCSGHGGIKTKLGRVR